MTNPFEKSGSKSMFSTVIPLIEAGFLVPAPKHLDWFIDTFFQTKGKRVVVERGSDVQWAVREELDDWFKHEFHLVPDEEKIMAYLQDPLLKMAERNMLLSGFTPNNSRESFA